MPRKASRNPFPLPPEAVITAMITVMSTSMTMITVTTPTTGT